MMDRLLTSSISREVEEKEKCLRRIIQECGSMVIAYSGGVDSTLVAQVAHQELGEKSLAVIADSPSLTRRELDDALTLAEEHGFSIRVITTDEVDHSLYRANLGNRCYFCKQILYDYLEMVRKEMDFRYLANGDHADDRWAHRPGRQAAEEQQVRSPLAEAGFTKNEVRTLAWKLGLPNFSKPASPCLSSRIPTGNEVTPKKLSQVEKAEDFLKTRYRIHDLRVRHHGSLAQVEIQSEYFSIIENQRKEISNFFIQLGFAEWRIVPFRKKNRTTLPPLS